MNPRTDLPDATIRQLLARRSAAGSSRDLLAAIVAKAATEPQRRPGLRALGWLSGDGMMRPLQAAVAISAVVVLVVAGGWLLTNRGSTLPGAGSSATPVASDATAPCSDTLSGWQVIGVRASAPPSEALHVAVNATQAGGPQDPAIPTVTLEPADLAAIGFCSPLPPLVPNRVPVITAWRTALSGTAETMTVSASAISSDFGTRPGAIFAAPEGASAWGPGRYVFRVVLGPLVEDSYWFAVVVTATS